MNLKKGDFNIEIHGTGERMEILVEGVAKDVSFGVFSALEKSPGFKVAVEMALEAHNELMSAKNQN